jgi:hypothetical protein
MNNWYMLSFMSKMTMRSIWHPFRLLGVWVIAMGISASAQSVSKPHAENAAAYAKLRLGFEENQGQLPDHVQFVARNPGLTLLLTQTEVWMAVDGAAASLRFAGSSPAARPAGIEPLTSVTNYLTGNDPSKWRTEIRQYGKVVYSETYPGIDAVYYGDGRTLEFDLNVHPGADTRTIRVAYGGVKALRITDGGDVAFSVGDREIIQRKPTAYQSRPDGSRVSISVAYGIDADTNEVALDVGVYDRSRMLVIDPILEYGTFFGGSGFDGANALAVDSSGNAYITGYTQSINLPPSPTRPFQSALAGPGDAFVAKINAAGSALIYTTYLGGTGDDQVTGIAVDASGNAYVSGLTNSTNFPTLGAGGANGLSASYAGGPHDAFVSVLNAGGSALIYSGYLGGPGDDVANNLAIDANANIYVTGYSNSTRITGINSSSGQPSNAGGYDAFVTKLSRSGAILFCTFFGGTGDDISKSVALDSSGNAYITGSTTSPFLPTSSTSRHGSQNDVFMAKFAAATGALASVLDMGGSSDQVAYAITVDSSNAIYLTGTTNSTDFPIIAPFQSRNGGGYDAFMVQLNPSSTTGSSCHCLIAFSTYLGGSGTDVGHAIAVTHPGSITVAGYTDSSNFLPSLPNRPAAGPNTFIAQFTQSSATLAGIGQGNIAPTFSTYFGAFDSGNPVSLALHPTTLVNEIFVAGYANAAFTFPSSASSPLRPYGGGASDAFIAKLGQATLSISISTIGPYVVGSSAPGSGPVIPGLDALIPITISNFGPDAASNLLAQVQLPPGVTFISCQGVSVSSTAPTGLLSQAITAAASSPPASCTVSGSQVTITAPSLGPQSTLMVGLVANFGASLNNTQPPVSASVESGTLNSNQGNNSYMQEAQVQGQAPAGVDMNALNFGIVTVGQTKTLSLMLTVKQDVTLNVSILPTDQGPLPVVFSATGVKPGDNSLNSSPNPYPISVQFTPIVATSVVQTLQFKDDKSQIPFSVSLMGNQTTQGNQGTTYTISGTISPASVGATLTLTNSNGVTVAPTTADATGAYSFSGLANGTYTVTPTLAGYNYTPPSATLTINGANQTANFTATAMQVSVTVSKILSQLAFGGGWYTALYFTNLGNSPVSFPINFIGDNGAALPIPNQGNSVTVNLAARGVYKLEIPNTGSLAQGYVSAALPNGVTGYGVFRQSISGINDQEAVVPLSDSTATTSTLVFDDTNYITSVAVANLSSAANVITATAYDNQGNVIGTGSIPLGPNAKTEFRLRDVSGLSGVTGRVGSVDFTAPSGNVAGLGLRFNGAAFTSIPTAAASVTAATKILTQLAFGGGWYTALYFTNLSNASVTFVVNFIGDNGQPLSVPNQANPVKLTLPARGVERLEIPNIGSLMQGYVSAALPSGVTGYAVFRQSIGGINDQEAVVPLSDSTATTSTLVFDDTNYITSVAVANLSSAANLITATAYDNQGNVIGTGNIPLGPNAKTEFRLRDVSALSGVAGRVGSVDFTAPSGNVAGLGLRFNGAAFTSIPASH